MKLLLFNNNLTVVLDDGRTFHKSFTPEEKCLLDEILSTEDQDFIEKVMNPNYYEKKEQFEKAEDFLRKVRNSKIVRIEGVVLTIPQISTMSCPVNLVERIIEAEISNNEDKLTSLLNFWKLCTLNPSDVTRQNLFWFLEKNGMTITKDGLFVAYRNVILKNKIFSDLKLVKVITNYFNKVKFEWKKSPSNYEVWYDNEENIYSLHKENEDVVNKYFEDLNIDEDEYDVDCLMELIGNLQQLYNDYTEYKNEKEVVFTDQYSGTTRIVIGQPVSIPRNQVDCDNSVQCSFGLHCGSKHWLQENYFGDIGIVVLVNPADVCSVPFNEDYGKMRVCRYFPIAFSERNENGKLQDTTWLEGAEKMFVEHISYEGEEGKDSDFQMKTVENPDKPKSVSDLLNEFKNIKKGV